MGDVSDLRLATAEERMTEYIAEKTADARAQLAALERAIRPEHRRSPMTSRGACGHRGNRHHSSSSSSSALRHRILTLPWTTETS